MSDVNARQVMEEMMLRQIGAQVLSIHGIHSFVKFEINGHRVNYLFNINANNKYYLQRIKPYPMAIGVLDTTTEVVEAIEHDIELFRSATKSGNYENFVRINTGMIETRKKLEELFLNYNVDREMLDVISRQFEDIDRSIESFKREDKRIMPVKG